MVTVHTQRCQRTPSQAAKHHEFIFIAFLTPTGQKDAGVLLSHYGLVIPRASTPCTVNDFANTSDIAKFEGPKSKLVFVTTLNFGWFDKVARLLIGVLVSYDPVSLTGHALNVLSVANQ